MENIISYFSQILTGFSVTMKTFFITLVISIPFGVLISYCRLSKIKILSEVTNLYIWIFRGTPLLLQIMFIFFGLPFLNINIDRMPSVYLAFALNYSAYFGEIFRSGIQSIEKGQKEVAKILGFSSWQINKKIILPQVIKRTLPSIGNEVIALVKDTSLVYIVGASDMLKIGRSIANRDATLVPYIVVAIIFLTLTFIITKIFAFLEKKVNYEE